MQKLKVKGLVELEGAKDEILNALERLTSYSITLPFAHHLIEKNLSDVDRALQLITEYMLTKIISDLSSAF